MTQIGKMGKKSPSALETTRDRVEGIQNRRLMILSVS